MYKLCINQEFCKIVIVFFFFQRDGCIFDIVNSVKYLKEVYRKVDLGLILND